MTTENTPARSNNIARIAVRSTVWVGLGTYLNILIGFSATLVLTRLLGPEVFGFFSMAVFWSTLLNLRTKAALNYAAIQNPHTTGELMGTYLALDLIAAGGSLLLSILCAAVLSLLGYREEIIRAMVVLMIADALSVIVSPLSMVLEKELQLSRVTLNSVIASVLAYTAAIFIALNHGGLWSLLAINLVTTLASIGGIYWICKRRWPQAFVLEWRFSRDVARRLLRVGLPTGLSLAAMSSIVTQFDNFLIGTFVGYTTLGYYDRAYRIAHWPNLLLTMIIGRVGFLTFAKIQHDLPRLTHSVRMTLWALTTLGIPMALVLFFGAPDIIGILYGPSWIASTFFLRFLAIYSLFWPFVSVGFWLCIALGHTRQATILTATQALTLVVIATPLTLRFGVDGTIAGVFITMLASFGLSCYYLFRQVPLSIDAVFRGPALAALVAIGMILMARQIIQWDSLAPILRLSIVGVLGPGTFGVALFALRSSEMTERIRYLRQVWNRE